MKRVCRTDHATDNSAAQFIFSVGAVCCRVLFALIWTNVAHAQVDPLGINPDSSNYGRYASIAISSSGIPFIAYENQVAAAGMTLTLCDSALCKLSDNLLLDPEGSANSSGTYATMLLPPDQLPLIVHAKIGAGGGVRVVKCVNGDCGVGMAGPPNSVVSVGSNGYSPVDVSASVGSDGLPVISTFFQDASPRGLWVIKCSDPACTGPISESQIDPARPESGRHSVIAIGADGNPVVAYQDRDSAGSNGNLMVLKCNDLACIGNDESFAELEPLGGTTDRIIDLAIDANGNPVLALTTVIGELGLLVCNDPACLGGDESFSVVTTQGAVGFAVALAINSQGLPALAAHGFASGDGSLEIIACNDPLCVGGDERSVELFDSIDPDVSFGRYVDIAYANNDLLSVVYMREERITGSQFNRSLRVVDCQLRGCTLLSEDGFEEPLP